MLRLVIPPTEEWDSKNEEFIYTDAIVLELEHTLVSLSKWEAIWEKPFLGPDEKTTEEILGYIGVMSNTPNLSPEVFQRLTQAQVDQVSKYLNAKMTATWFNDTGNNSGKKSREIITAEIIYYWMITLNIPIEFENWHLSRLFTLIEVCNRKNQPAKKNTRSRSDMIAERRRLNAQRQAQMKSQ
jgi:hypothetical protein